MAFRSDGLREAVLKEKKGSIANTSAFSGIGAEFASASDPGGRQLFLRDLNNVKSLRADAGENRVSAVEPHDLSEVLGGSLYAVMRKIYDAVWRSEARDSPDPSPFASRSLYIAAERFKRMILRALDYLPPGEVSFADYGRAILASDQASYPDARDGEPRDWIRREFVDRGIVESAKELEVETNVESKAIAGLDLDTLASSDWRPTSSRTATGPSSRSRRGSRSTSGPGSTSPSSTTSETTEPIPRRRARGYRKIKVRELIFKVKWDVQEPSGLGRGFPSRRKVTRGTTLAIDWDRRIIRARLTSDGTEERRADRDEFLRRLVARGDLRFDGEALGPDGHPLPSVILAEALDGVMSVRGASRLMHVACCPGAGDDR